MMDRRSDQPDELDFSLDMLGQHPLLQIYTQMTLCYPVPHPGAQPSIVDTLTRGLERVSAAFPWIAGQIIRGEDGLLKIRSLARTPVLVVKDVSEDASAPTMDGLRRAHFPMGQLDENLLAFRKTLPGAFDGPAEVLSVQAVFIRGGLLLTFTGSHAAMDMVGQGEVIKLIAKACRREEFTHEELATGNLRRDDLVPLLDESFQPGPELTGTLGEPRGYYADPEAPPPPKCSWVNFECSGRSLAQLKRAAGRTLPADGPAKFVSTDDVLTAFVWQSITRVRGSRILDDVAKNRAGVVKMARAVDMRSRLGVSLTYPGLMQTGILHTQSMADLIQPPSIGAVAADMRAALLPSQQQQQQQQQQRNGGGGGEGEARYDLVGNMRTIVTVISRSQDHSGAFMTAGLDLDSDIMLSSWAKVFAYSLDFGFGRPESVRRPRFDTFESLVYLLPRDPEGGVAISACLRDEEIARLREDAEFTKHAVYVG